MNITPTQLEEEFKKFGPIKRGGIQIRSFQVLFYSYLHLLFSNLPINFVFISDTHIQVQQNGFSFGFVDFEVADAVARAIEVFVNVLVLFIIEYSIASMP